MGERAVVAFIEERTDKTHARHCDVYRSQWAGSTETLSNTLQSAGRLESLSRATWQFDRRCDVLELLSRFDFLSVRVLYLVTPAGVRVFQPLWFGRPLEDGPESSRLGAFAPVESLEQFRSLERRLRVAKSVVGRLRRPISFSSQRGLRWLSDALAAEVRWYSPQLFYRLCGICEADSTQITDYDE